MCYFILQVCERNCCVLYSTAVRILIRVVPFNPVFIYNVNYSVMLTLITLSELDILCVAFNTKLNFVSLTTFSFRLIYM